MQRFRANTFLQPRFATLTASALLCALPLLTACSKQSGPAGNAPAPASDMPHTQAEMTPAEIKYGVSPTLNSQVTYQPDVIVMEHGAEAVRGLSSDGLTYNIDGNATGAKGIAPGKILFTTGRVVGRVLAVKPSGSDLAVTLGPIELTDVFKEAHFHYHGTLDPDKVIMYVAPPDYPGTFIDRNAAAPSAMRGTRDAPMQIAQLWQRNGDRRAVFDIARNASRYSACGGGPAGQIVDIAKNGLPASFRRPVSC